MFQFSFVVNFNFIFYNWAKEVLLIKYDVIEDFNNSGYAPVKINGKWGIIGFNYKRSNLTQI